jgi:hypothetical protein
MWDMIDWRWETTLSTKDKTKHFGTASSVQTENSHNEDGGVQDIKIHFNGENGTGYLWFSNERAQKLRNSGWSVGEIFETINVYVSTACLFYQYYNTVLQSVYICRGAGVAIGYGMDSRGVGVLVPVR